MREKERKEGRREDCRRERSGTRCAHPHGPAHARDTHTAHRSPDKTVTRRSDHGQSMYPSKIAHPRDRHCAERARTNWGRALQRRKLRTYIHHAPHDAQHRNMRNGVRSNAP